MRLKRFFKDQRASAAPIFAGALIPVLTLVGAGVDYSRASAVRTSMQSALDSTALAMSKDAASATPDQFSTNAKAYFDAVFNRSDVSITSFTANFSNTDGSKIIVVAYGQIKTTFLNLAGIGIPKIDIAASATSTWSNKRLRVAMALDNTGSMAQSGKLTALKTATHNLLAQLQAVASQPGDIYVSIIPFAKDVNVGTAAASADWIDWTYWDAANGTCSRWGYNSKSACTSHSGTWMPASRSTWNGCVTDRDQNYDTNNAASIPTNASTKFPAEQYNGCPASLMPMTDNWTALNQKVDTLIATGNTNQTIGLQWAWQSLSSVAPLNAPAKDPNFQYQDVIILLTDGLNTENRWTTSPSAIDLRTAKACDNAKAAGVTIYTILVMAGNGSLLQNCASDASKYFALTDANQIITAFHMIGTNLAQLHIAK
jgi:Flp pilus assembly protein TadG